MRKLLLTYCWSTGDIGGVGITPGLLKLVKETAPNLDVSIITLHGQVPSDLDLLTPPPETTIHGKSIRPYDFLRGYLLKFYPQARVLPNPFGGCFGSLANPGKVGAAWHKFCRRWGATKLRDFENGTVFAHAASEMARDVLDTFALELFAQLKKAKPHIARSFEDADFVLYNSGTVFNFGRMGKRHLWGESGVPGGSTGLMFAMPLLFARILGIPYGINAHSFDAVDWPVDLVYRPLFKDAQFLYCRDSDSLEYLKQRDMLNANSGYRPDSAFFFRTYDDAWADAFMRKHALEKKSFVCFVPRLAETIGVISGTMSADREKDHLEKIRFFIDNWLKETGMPVVLCPEAGCDVLKLKKIYQGLSPEARKRVVCMNSFWTPEQACSLYKRSRFIVGHMHSIIFSLSAGTPALHIPFSEAGRKAWMMGDLGLDDWLLNIDEVSGGTLVAAALKIHNHYDTSCARVRRAMENVDRLGRQVIGEMLLKGKL